MIKSLIKKLKVQLEDFQSLSLQEKHLYSYISLSSPITEHLSLMAARVPANTKQCFYLSKPNCGISLLGLGSLISFKSQGEQRFSSIKNDYNTILKTCYRKDKTKADLLQAFMVFAFDENDKMSGKWQHCPNTILTIPEILISETAIDGENVQQTITINIKLKKESRFDKLSYDKVFSSIKHKLKQYRKQSYQQIPARHYVSENIVFKNNDKQFFKTLAHKAITQIKLGLFDKLVTSRCCSIKVDKTISLTQLITHLKTHYPSCTIVSYQFGEKIIVAASPERLFRLNHPLIESDAIGGTIQKTKKTKRSLNSKALLTIETDSKKHKKLLKEHLFIGHDIYQRLDPLCHSLKIPISPLLMKLHNMYHLEALVEGTLKTQYHFFEVLDVLHPTPAVAGFPAQKAKQWLIHNEDYNRGWYSGAFGLVNSNLDGELSVMIRCALINDNKIDMFAGAGLVAESDPETEWLETEIKMRTILEQL